MKNIIHEMNQNPEKFRKISKFPKKVKTLKVKSKRELCTNKYGTEQIKMNNRNYNYEKKID